MSDKDNRADLFVELLKSERESNIDDAKRKFKMRFAGTAPNTVQDYADEFDLSYDQALKELTDDKISLGKFVPKKDTALERFFRKNDPTYNLYAGKEDKELELSKDGKYVIAKDRPTGVLGGLATVADFLTLGITDFDRRGGGIGGMATGLGYTPDQYNQKISKKGRKELEKGYVTEALEDASFDTLGNVLGGDSDSGTSDSGSSKGKTLEQRLDDFYKRQDERSRKKRRKEAIQDTVITTLQTPIYTRLVEDAAKRRLELDKAMLAAREMMPSNIQKIMKSKQEQANLAADAEYRRALGVAAQQDAATRFAGLGMQRQFG